MINNNKTANKFSKRPYTKRKVPDIRKGKSQQFKDGVNPRRLTTKKTVDGYILEYSEKEGGFILQHRRVIEESIGRKLVKGEVIHHINSDKTDNTLDNLFLCENKKHSQVHASVHKIINELLKLNIINFSKTEGKYYINQPENSIESFSVSLDFDDVYIEQRKNICDSRLDTDISSEVIRGIRRPIPLVASNMSTVTNSDFCIDLYKRGALGVMHRADTDENLCSEISKISKECEVVCGSIGVGEDQYILADKLIKSGANVLFVDIAHGYSDAVITIGKWVKKTYPFVKLVIGNTTNIGLAYECAEFADAIKVGLANGLACETAITAGCTEGQFTTVFKFRELSKKLGLPVISDGGIRKAADYVKALGAGASSVMAGSIFARCPESASVEIYSINGEKKKLYAGMASRYVQEQWRNGLKPGTCPEGRTVLLDPGESLKFLLERYSGALRSAITYAGVNSLDSFKYQAIFGKHYKR